MQVLQAGLAPWPGVGAIALAAAAFVVSRNVRNTDFFTVIVFPGPIIGIIIGLGIFGLGMVMESY